MEIRINCGNQTIEAGKDNLEYQKIVKIIGQKFGLSTNDYFLQYEGRALSQNNFHKIFEKENLSFQIQIKGQGGKGGFGSLLRGQAVTKKKFDNRDASRDLSGRRIRNAINEQRLKEFTKWKIEEDIEIKEELKKFKEIQKSLESNTRTTTYNKADVQANLEKWKEIMHDSISDAIKKKKSDNSPEEGLSQKKQKREENKHPSLNVSDLFESILSEKEKQAILAFKTPPSEFAESKATQNNIDNEQKEGIDYSLYSSSFELEVLGAEKLKAELIKLGLKCGGTVSERAKRLWNVQKDPLLLFSTEYKAKAKPAN